MSMDVMRGLGAARDMRRKLSLVMEQSRITNYELRLNRGTALDSTDWLGPIEIRWDYETDPAPFLGMFGVPITVRHGIT